MIIDHIGAFLMPDQEMLRIIGRAAAPVFCFLIAFSNSKKIDFSLLTLGVSIVTIDFILFGKFSPNILITLFALRYLNSALANKDFKITLYDSIPFAFLVFILFPILQMLEYSSAALIPYLLGHVVRLNHKHKHYLMIILGALYFLFLNTLAGITAYPLFLSGYIITTFIIMATIEPAYYPTKIGPHKWCVYYLGKYALQIYFIHLALFKLTAFYISEYGHLLPLD